MRLLVINPNTTQAITDAVALAVRAMTPGDIDVHPVTAAFGPRYIASRSAFAIASHAALDAYAAHGAGAHAVLLACFGDPGLDALREVSPVPVTGLVEAAAAEAGASGRRFAIVTGGALWGPMLKEMLKARGWDAQCAGIYTVAPSGAAIAADPDGALDMLVAACTAAVQERSAQAIILGGAGLVGLAARVGARVDAPVICSVEAGVRAALASLGRSSSPEEARQPVDAIGLSPALTALMLSAPDGRVR